MLYLQRLTFGLKRLFMQPALSVPVILSLGLTLAAVLTVLSIYYALMIRPLPQIKAPEELSVHTAELQMGSMTINILSKPLFLNLKQYMQSYGAWGYLVLRPKESIQIDQQDYELTLLEASSGTPELLGVQLLVGESSSKANEHSGVWISETVWQRLYDRDNDIIGKILSHRDKIYRIAGVYKDIVAIPDNTAPTELQFWHFFDEKILQTADKNSFGSPGIAILRGTQLPDEAAMVQWRQQAEQDFPILTMIAAQGVIHSNHDGYRAAILGDSATLVWLLLAVTITLLIIAVLNLTNLMLAHYQSRRQEFAVQILTGCSATKLKLLVAIENLSLVVPALIVGVLASLWLIKSLPLWAGNSLPLLSSIQLNGTVLTTLFGLGIVLLLFFSSPVQPPLKLADAMNSSGKGQVKQQKSALVNCLFVGQLVLSTIIICGSTLLAYQGYLQIYTNYGFNLVNSYLINTDPKNKTESSLQQTNASYQQYQQRNELLQQKIKQQWPHAIVMNSRQQPIDLSVKITEFTDGQSNTSVTSNFAMVDNQYFTAYGIPLLYGSFFTAQEAEQQLIIDLTMAKIFSPDNPSQMIGRRLGDKQVIGVVAPVKSINDMPTTYLASKAQATESQLLVLVLPDGEYLTVSEIKIALGEIASEYPELKIESMKQNWQNNTRQQRIHFYLISVISATCLLLAILGIAGMSQQQSRQKRYEIAVRMATGASQQQLLWFAGYRSGLLLLLGLALGAAFTLLIFNYLSSYFSILSTLNWHNLLVLDLGLMLIALSAMLFPCWQVIRRDPIKSLRNQ